MTRHQHAPRGSLGAPLGFRAFLFSSLVVGSTSLAACSSQQTPPGGSYFDERIAPGLSTSCVRQNNGCHLVTPEGNAAGNLDTSSFTQLMLRDDVLDPYGPYPVGLLLLKPGEPREIQVEGLSPSRGVEAPRTAVRTDIRHAGGRTLELGTEAYSLLTQWIRNGHTETGAPVTTLRENVGSCVSGVGHAPGFDASVAPANAADFQRFRDDVMPVLRDTCAGSSCHGNPIVDFYLNCGANEEELRWNYFAATSFVAPGATRSISQLLRQPLAVRGGGAFHEGGDVLPNVDDPRYRVIETWVNQIPEEAFPEPVPAGLDEDGLRFFASRVQPVLVRSGCMFSNCHSPSMFHDLRLRGGAGGHFGHLATVRNYEMARELLALDSDDPDESRLIAKNLFPPTLVPGAEGLVHRGGSLFETFPSDASGTLNVASPDDCVGVDADAGALDVLDSTGDTNANGTPDRDEYVHPYCVLVRWWEIEREALRRNDRVDAEPLRALVYVQRPDGVGSPLDFDTYRPGAELMRVSLTLAADGSVMVDGAASRLDAGCGFADGMVDIRGPAASWNGDEIAFAARTADSIGYRLYRVGVDGSGCAPIGGLGATEAMVGGVRIHDFDPAYAPDGRLVFASTRGYADTEAVGVAGPTRTPASLAPNANLYIRDGDGSIRQLTYLLNQELSPSFMSDGRLIFSSEKRETDFHQLAGRRLNLDGGDYHPLFAQRDSVGFHAAFEISEAFDRNLVFVAADLDAVEGGGDIAVINRSLGPDQSDRPAGDRSYLASMWLPTYGARRGGRGLYRSPTPLPNGSIIASCSVDATSATTPTTWDLCVIDPARREPGATSVRRLLGEAGSSEVDAVAVVRRGPRAVFTSRFDEANGHTRIVAGQTDAEILVNDLPMLASLLFTNTRIGRSISPDIAGFDLYDNAPAPASATSFDALGADVETDSAGRFYARRTRVGHVDLDGDGSAFFRIRGGSAMQLVPTGRDGQPISFSAGAPFSGIMRQREHMQFYPGERSRQSMPRVFFNGLCGGCHGSISGREVDVAVDVDVLTRASVDVMALGHGASDLRAMR